MLGNDGKSIAASKALELDEVVDSRIIGVGTGSTVKKFIELMPERFFRDKFFVASSWDTVLRLRSRGARVLDLMSVDRLDVYVDGADAVDPNGNLIKGGGAALLREKILANMAHNFVVIVDKSKIVDDLRVRRLPLEVVPQALSFVLRRLKEIGFNAEVRVSGKGKWGPVSSDSCGAIVDLDFSVWEAGLDELDIALKRITGVVETGLFIGMTDILVVGGDKPVVRRF